MKKRIISALAALLFIFSASASAFAQYVPVFTECEKTAEDEAFEQIYTEAEVFLLRRNYASQVMYLNDPVSYFAERGYEMLELSSRPLYTRLEILDIFAGFDARLAGLDRAALSDRNKFRYDRMRAFFAAEETGRDVDDIFFSDFDSNNFNFIPAIIVFPVNVWFDNAEEFEKVLFPLIEDSYDVVRASCEKELARIDKGLVLAPPKLEYAYTLPEQARSLTSREYLDILLEDATASEEEYDALFERFDKLMNEKWYPAIDLMLDTLDTEFASQDKRRPLCEIEGGSEYFRYLFRTYLGISRDPDELFEEISEDYEKVFERMYKLLEDPETTALSLEPFGEEISGLPAEEAARIIFETVGRHFPDPINRDYEVRHEVFTGGTMGKYQSSLEYDGKQNTISIYDVGNEYFDDYFWFFAQTIAHEGIPGHMLNNDYIIAQNDLLPFMMYHLGRCRGFTEGWAFYVERYVPACFGANAPAQEWDLLINDEVTAQELLASFAAHYYGLSADEFAARYSSGSKDDIDDALNVYYGELNDLFSGGQYYFGAKLLRNARARAEEALGEYFSDKEFHQFVMDLALCDFDTFDRWTDVWIEKTLAAHSEKEVPDTGADSVSAFAAAALIAFAAAAVSRKKVQNIQK